MDMSDSNDTVPVDEGDANKKEKLIRVHRLKLRQDLTDRIPTQYLQR